MKMYKKDTSHMHYSSISGYDDYLNPCSNRENFRQLFFGFDHIYDGVLKERGAIIIKNYWNVHARIREEAQLNNPQLINFINKLPEYNFSKAEILKFSSGALMTHMSVSNGRTIAFLKYDGEYFSIKTETLKLLVGFDYNLDNISAAVCPEKEWLADSQWVKNGNGEREWEAYKRKTVMFRFGSDGNVSGFYKVAQLPTSFVSVDEIQKFELMRKINLMED